MLTCLAVRCVMLAVVAAQTQTDFYPDLGPDHDYDTDNITDFGRILGGPCEDSCSQTLNHVTCNKKTLICECEAGYPVRLGSFTGCAKPVGLGEQCFYYQTCMYTDQNADCVQISHNAVCKCKEGYHQVTVQRPIKRVFCSQDLVVIATDLSTLLGVASGLAIFTALICFVLRLFSGSRPRHYANTNLAPPIIFAQSASVHSSTSSTKSFSARQYERERENRLLAKARERERGDGGSTSPRSMENIIGVSDSCWPHLEEERGEAFSPDMLDEPPDTPFPDIDQCDSTDGPLCEGPLLLQVVHVEHPFPRPQDLLQQDTAYTENLTGVHRSFEPNVRPPGTFQDMKKVVGSNHPTRTGSGNYLIKGGSRDDPVGTGSNPVKTESSGDHPLSTSVGEHFLRSESCDDHPLTTSSGHQVSSGSCAPPGSCDPPFDKMGSTKTSDPFSRTS